MGFWKILQPELSDIINLVTNPSIEDATTGYAAAVGGSIARSSTRARRGAYSLAVTPSTDSLAGAYYDAVALANGEPYNYSLDVWGVSSIPYTAYFADTLGTQKGTATTWTGAGKWKRVAVQWTADTDLNVRLYITKNNSSSTDDFYVDGVQCVNLDHETSHIDGDQDGCDWDEAEHASTSTRDGQARGVGEEIDLEGLGVYVNTYQGIGLPPAKHHTLNQALLPGAKFLGRKVLPRMVTLNADAQGSSHANMHAIRQTFIDLIKPDLTKDDEPFTLRYYGADSDNPLDLHCVYDAGDEFTSLDGFTDHSSIRAIAYDPYWHEEGNDSKQLTINASLTSTNRILRRQSSTDEAEWQKFGTGMSGTVIVIAQDRKRGRIYVGGDFITGNGVTLNNIGYWNGTTFVAMDSGTNGIVRDLAIEPNGDVWVAGDFTTVGGGAAACKGLARWNYGSNTWTGFNPATTTFTNVETVVLDTSGNLYIGGLFTDWDGIANADHIAKYNGTSWSALGTGMNNLVYEAAIDGVGNLWVGGQFTTGNGVTLNGIGYWNGTTFVSIGGLSGGSAYANSFAKGLDGAMYFGGSFTTAGGVSASRIARWNGSSVEALGTGLGSNANVLAIDDKGFLHVGGAFTTAGGITVVGYALWNGSSWAAPDVILPSSSVVNAIDTYKDDVFVGYTLAGTATVSEQTSVANLGTAIAYPVLHIDGTAFTAYGTNTVLFLKNETTRVTVWLNYPLVRGEELIIDFRPTRRSFISSYFGDAWRGVLRGSEFADFYLLPGTNWISLLISPPASGTISAWLEWRTAHWSADGA